MAVADPVPALHLGPGHFLVSAQGLFHFLPLRHGEGDGAALSLRPVDADRLEILPAAVARHGRHRRGRAAIRRAGAEVTMMKLDQAARTIFMTEFVSAFFLAMRYFFK